MPGGGNAQNHGENHQGVPAHHQAGVPVVGVQGQGVHNQGQDNAQNVPPQQAGNGEPPPVLYTAFFLFENLFPRKLDDQHFKFNIYKNRISGAANHGIHEQQVLSVWGDLTETQEDRVMNQYDLNNMDTVKEEEMVMGYKSSNIPGKWP